MPRKRSPSSEQTPSGAEVRRSQVRQAQRVYHARRKEAFSNLEQRVRFLEQSVQDMSNIMISLNDALVSSPAFRRQPELVRQLENALRQTLTSASTVHPSGQDVSTTPAPTANDAEASSAAPSRSNPRTGPARPILPFGDESSTIAGLALLERRILAMANSGFTMHPSSSITVTHPMASLMFPYFEQWSAFGLRLYWNTLSVAYSSIADYKSSLGPEIFRYTLASRSRERILTGLRRLLDFKAMSPPRPDGSVVLVQRSRPNFLSTTGDGPAEDAESPEEVGRNLYQWMCDIERLQISVSGAIECSPRDAKQEWLRANEVESYLEARGARLLPDTSIVELPLASGSRSSSQAAMDVLDDLDTMEPAWDALEMDIITSSAPDDQGQLYAFSYADADADASSTPNTTTSAPASSTPALAYTAPTDMFSPPGPRSTSSSTSAPAYSAYASAFDPLSWHEPRSVFPNPAQAQAQAPALAYSGDDSGPSSQFVPPYQTQSQPQPQPQTQPSNDERRTVSMDDLIQAFSTIGVCVGGGARYPSRAIDATLDALAMGQGLGQGLGQSMGQMVY